MSKNNSELWNLFPELLNCFYFYFYYFFNSSHIFVWSSLFSGQDEVRTSNLLHLLCDFLHSGLMLQQLSSATSPTESLLTSYYTTLLTNHNCHVVEIFDYEYPYT